jgi:DNA-directed RNA polymerase specialized sigma24 family protein
MVVRMANEEALSLAPLAAKLSVSKERAGQLMRKGRASLREQTEGPS